MRAIEQFLQENSVSPEVQENLRKHTFNSIESFYKHEDDLVIVVSKFHDYSSGGGVARDSILTVFYKENIREEKWRYSDKWSSRNDRWDLLLREVQRVHVDHKDSQATVTIECLGGVNYPNRTIKFNFPI